MRWWTTRGERASDRRSEEASLLEQCMHAWGRQVLHVFDRGFAGVPWLTTLTAWQSRWLLRWPTRYHLVDDQGRERPAWQITRGKRSRATRLIRYGTQLQAIGLYWCAVQHPKLAVPLWLVVSRRGHGHQPWYLLTTEPVASADDAWQMVLAYARRWQIEMAWRSSKTELAYESPRCWQWETRRKLLMLASLAYAFLLWLLILPEWCGYLLRVWCHRTGARSRDVTAPLYRLRSAISRLWLAAPPARLVFPKNSG